MVLGSLLQAQGVPCRCVMLAGAVIKVGAGSRPPSRSFFVNWADRIPLLRVRGSWLVLISEEGLLGTWLVTGVLRRRGSRVALLVFYSVSEKLVVWYDRGRADAAVWMRRRPSPVGRSTIARTGACLLANV